jgi:glutathione-regulated potassium-efflux system protein KefB
VAILLFEDLLIVPVLALRRWGPVAKPSLDGVEAPENRTGAVPVIGFGRFGQVASQHVLALGADVTIIDRDPQAIRDAADFGFKVCYGDGTHLDVLRAAGAESARAILVCVDGTEATNRIVERTAAQFRRARVLARVCDREHALELQHGDGDFQIREVFESAMVLGRAATLTLGATPDEAAEIEQGARSRDAERSQPELVGGLCAGRALILGNLPAAAKK